MSCALSYKYPAICVYIWLLFVVMVVLKVWVLMAFVSWFQDSGRSVGSLSRDFALDRVVFSCMQTVSPPPVHKAVKKLPCQMGGAQNAAKSSRFQQYVEVRGFKTKAKKTSSYGGFPQFIFFILLYFYTLIKICLVSSPNISILSHEAFILDKWKYIYIVFVFRNVKFKRVLHLYKAKSPSGLSKKKK